jgi:hypothetical protein
MPFYIFACETTGCKEYRQEFRPKWTPDKPECSEHGPMERNYHLEARRHIPGAAFPFVTKNITGSPVEVRDQHHLDELCKQHNVVQRNDAAWTQPMDERYNLGRFNWKTHEWEGRGYVRKESSGVGVKGCWI